MAGSLKILLVEDNKTDTMLIEEMFYEATKKSLYDDCYELIRKEFLRDAVDYLAGNKVDVILLDLSLPDSKSQDTVKKMLEEEKNTPIVVLTGLDDETVAMSALQEGAQDYLNKNYVDSILLIRSIKYAMERFNNLREKEVLIRELQEAVENVKTLSGLLPICSNCKDIRTDDGYWIQVESYLRSHSGLNFTHGLCPVCVQKLYSNYINNKKKVKEEKRRHPRKRVSFPALISVSSSDDTSSTQAGLVTDISLDGLRISITNHHEFAIRENRDTSRISIVFAVPESKRPVTIQCLPRHTFRSNGETNIGASLVDTDHKSYRELQHYINGSR